METFKMTEKNKTSKDFFGNTLSVGDYVAYAKSSSAMGQDMLFKSVITEIFSNGNIQLEGTKSNGVKYNFNRYPKDVIKDTKTAFKNKLLKEASDLDNEVI